MVRDLIFISLRDIDDAVALRICLCLERKGKLLVADFNPCLRRIPPDHALAGQNLQKIAGKGRAERFQFVSRNVAHFNRNIRHLADLAGERIVDAHLLVPRPHLPDTHLLDHCGRTGRSGSYHREENKSYIANMHIVTPFTSNVS